MAETAENAPRLSRRMWLAGLGGGLVAGPFVYWFGSRRGRDVDPHAAHTTSSGYVDRDGWILTVEDAAALAAKPPSQ